MATRVRRYVDEDVVDDAEVVNRSVTRAPWSPAQFVALIIGAILAIVGGIVLAKAGVNFNDIASHHVRVLGMDQTAVLGIAELAVGLFVIGAGAIPGGARGGMTFFGVLLLGFCIALMIMNTSTNTSVWMHKWLGHDGTGPGWFFAILGVILLVTAMVAPVVFGTDRQVTSRRSAVVER